MQLPIVDFVYADGKVKTTEDIFLGRNTVVLCVVGAYNDACAKMLSAFESAYEQITDTGITQVLCMSVNDSNVLDAWAASRGVSNVVMLPDGNGDFATKLQMIVPRQNTGMAGRFWRAVLVINAEGDLVASCIEDGMRNLPSTDPYEATTPKKVLEAIANANRLAEESAAEAAAEAEAE